MDKTSTMEDAFEQLIGKASQLQTQLDLQDKFQTNLQAIKRLSPALYDTFKNYTPTEYQLGFDETDSVNLYHIASGEPVYPNDPEQFCQEQYQAYLQKPLPCFQAFKHYKKSNYFRYGNYINQILDAYPESLKTYRGNIDLPIGLMLVGGMGLGYHLLAMIEHLEIHHLCLYEPNKDIFYASLHTLDWQRLIDYFDKPTKSFVLFLDRNNLHYLMGTKSLILKHGLPMLANGFYYNHLHSLPLESFFRELQQQFASLTEGYGSIEDETISLAHTLHNFKQPQQVLFPEPTLSIDVPCFIIANGPSLDSQIESIKACHGKAIVVSCGTAIRPLYHEGIVPDFHIEMERTYATTQHLLDSCDKNYLKQIKLIALNTVPPSATQLFEHVYFIFKESDAGTELAKTIHSSEISPLRLSNPTVTNTAMAAMLAIGFKNIYLFGADFGMKGNQHHASKSIYYDASNELASMDHDMPIKVHGNFGGHVKTNSLYNISRQYVSFAIANTKDVNVFNLSDGAYIDNTQPLTIQALLEQDLNVLDKDTLTAFLLEPHLKTVQLVKEEPLETLAKMHLNAPLNFLTAFSLPAEVASPSELLSLVLKLSLEVKALRHEGNELAAKLCESSIENFLLLLTQVCFAVKPEQFSLTYQHIRQLIERYLNDASTLLKTNAITEHTQVISNE